MKSTKSETLNFINRKKLDIEARQAQELRKLELEEEMWEHNQHMLELRSIYLKKAEALNGYIHYENVALQSSYLKKAEALQLIAECDARLRELSQPLTLQDTNE